ncbi:MAG: glutamine amidotransferase [Calditrichaeota bacterium]|nr:glutamine amidotransferase [Calditrichota bacterium]
MAKILIVKLGFTFSSLARERGDFENWVREKSKVASERFLIFNPAEKSFFPDVRQFAGVILTGSHNMVTDKHDWSQRTAVWLADSVVGKIPVLGICYGHQLLAQALGGAVDYNPDGTEIGTVALHSFPGAASDELFGTLEFPFFVHMSHSQSVTRLPDGAVSLAHTDRCQIGAFLLPPFAWGIQFHPEFDAHIVRRYVERAQEKLRREGQNPKQIFSQIQETPAATGVLQRFCQLCLKKVGTQSNSAS